jgi:hypothetical protein
MVYGGYRVVDEELEKLLHLGVLATLAVND